MKWSLKLQKEKGLFTIEEMSFIYIIFKRRVEVPDFRFAAPNQRESKSQSWPTKIGIALQGRSFLAPQGEL